VNGTAEQYLIEFRLKQYWHTRNLSKASLASPEPSKPQSSIVHTGVVKVWGGQPPVPKSPIEERPLPLFRRNLTSIPGFSPCPTPFTDIGPFTWGAPKINARKSFPLCKTPIVPDPSDL
jgi:hypothetical protein